MDIILKVVLGFIKDNWKTLLVIAFVLGVFFYWDHLTSTIKTQETTITNLKTDNKALTDKIIKEQVEFKTAIATQNKAIEDLNKKNVDNQQSINTAVQAVVTLKKQYDADIRRILAGQKPQTCDGAIKYLVDGAVEFVPSDKVVPLTGTPAGTVQGDSK